MNAPKLPFTHLQWATLVSMLRNLLKKSFTRLALFDIFLILWYNSYFIECEKCIDPNDCPPCIAPEQYFLIYLFVSINLSYGIYALYKIKKRNL